MEYAVHTCEQLQKMNMGHYKYSKEHTEFWERQETMKRTHSIVQYVVKEVLERAKRGERSFTTPITYYLPGDFKLNLENMGGKIYKTVDVLPYVLFYLRQQFPDCAVDIAEDERNLVVDWSLAAPKQNA